LKLKKKKVSNLFLRLATIEQRCLAAIRWQSLERQVERRRLSMGMIAGVGSSGVADFGAAGCVVELEAAG